MKLEDFDKYMIQYFIEYLDLEDINILIKEKISKNITENAESIIFRRKMNSPVCNKILKRKQSLEKIKSYPLIFFNRDYYKRGFKNFKKYIFYYTQDLLLKEFMLVSKMNKLLYVKEIDDNNILIVYDIDENNIYYSIMENRIKMATISMIIKEQPSGYIFKNGILQENINKHVLEIL